MNNLTVQATDEAGNGPSARTEPEVVIFDKTPPKISHGGPYNVEIGIPFQLNASGSYDLPQDEGLHKIINYTWIVSKEFLRYYYGKLPKVTISQFGKFTVSLIIKDNAGNSVSSSTYILVNDTTAPLVNAGLNRTVDEDKWVYFNVFNSSDNNPDFFATSTFKWLILTSDNQEFVMYGPKISYLFTEIGLYEMTLSATDSHNNTGMDTIYITVLDVTPPTAVGQGDITATEYHPVVLNASLSYDNDPSFEETGTYRWEFMDDGMYIVLTGISVSYTFIKLGSYELTLTATDPAGNSGYYVFIITVIEDVAPPEVLKTSPADLETEVQIDVDIKCTFTEAVKSFSINDRNYYITDSENNKLPGRLHYDQRNSTIVFIPFDLLSNNEIYYGHVQGTIEDLAGNQLQSDYTWYFSTVSPPKVLKTDPAPDAEGVSISTKLRVILNEPISPNSITPQTLVLYDNNGLRVDAEISYDNSTYAINLVPFVELSYSATYKLVLANNFVDLQGNRLEQNYTWSFTTMSLEEEQASQYSNVLLIVTFVIIIILIIFSVLIGTGKVDLIKLSKSFSALSTGKSDRKPKPSVRKQRTRAGDEQGDVRRQKKRKAVYEDDDYFDDADEFQDDDFLDWSEEELYRGDKRKSKFDDFEDYDEDEYTIDWQDK
jgi:hypothetical protein